MGQGRLVSQGEALLFLNWRRMEEPRKALISVRSGIRCSRNKEIKKTIEEDCGMEYQSSRFLGNGNLEFGCRDG